MVKTNAVQRLLNISLYLRNDIVSHLPTWFLGNGAFYEQACLELQELGFLVKEPQGYRIPDLAYPLLQEYYRLDSEKVYAMLKTLSEFLPKYSSYPEQKERYLARFSSLYILIREFLLSIFKLEHPFANFLDSFTAILFILQRTCYYLGDKKDYKEKEYLNLLVLVF